MDEEGLESWESTEEVFSIGNTQAVYYCHDIMIMSFLVKII